MEYQNGLAITGKLPTHNKWLPPNLTLGGILSYVATSAISGMMHLLLFTHPRKVGLQLQLERHPENSYEQ
jgi:hypothetical protein